MNTLSHPSTSFFTSPSRPLSRLWRAARQWLRAVQHSRRDRAAVYLQHQALRQLDSATLRDLGLAESSALNGTDAGFQDRRAL